MPQWTPEEKATWLQGKLCPACRDKGVVSVETACFLCRKHLPSPNGASHASLLPQQVAVNPGGEVQQVHFQYQDDFEHIDFPMYETQTPGDFAALPQQPELPEVVFHDEVEDGFKHVDLPWGEFPPDSMLAQVTQISREQVAAAFPHTPVFTNVKFSEDDWLIDERLIAYFAMNKTIPVARFDPYPSHASNAGGQ